jgi:peptide/nickel transport system permease protein
VTIGVLRAALIRTTAVPTVRTLTIVALAIVVAILAAPPVRLRVAWHPLDVAAFLVALLAVGAFWSTSSDVTRRMKRNPLSIAGFGIIALFVTVAMLAPVLTPPVVNTRDPYLIPHEGFLPDPKPPSLGHLLGTTGNQYDILYGIVWGTRTAFRVALVVVALSIALGLLMGSLAGYYGGRIDEVIMRTTDVFLAFPSLVLAVVITAVLGKGLDKVMIAIAVVGWPTYARLLRGDILSVKHRDYVEAARAAGASDIRIISQHVIPNAIYPFLVVAAFDMGVIVLVAAALSFLGLGAEVGYADWGQLINMSSSWILVCRETRSSTGTQ